MRRAGIFFQRQQDSPAAWRDGKIHPDSIEPAARQRRDIHFPKPGALSLTQVTEVGTVYSVAEIKTLAEAARHCGLRLQMDGARFANAVAALGVAPAELTWRAGVDVLCFGGSKEWHRAWGGRRLFQPRVGARF